MRAFISLAATSLLAAIAAASSTANPFNNPAGGYTFTAGQATALTWKPTTPGTVTLRLEWGAVTTANSGTVIASNIPNDGSYTWNVPAGIVAKPDYTIEIISDQNSNDYNYLPRFVIEGASPTGTTPAASSATPSPTSTSSTPSPTPESTPSSSSTSTSSSPSSSSSPAETKTTMTSTTASTSSSSTTSSSITSTSSSSAPTSATASSSTAPSQTSVPNTNAGVANRVSGGMAAIVVGALAVL